MDALLQFKQADGGFSHLMDGESDLLADGDVIVFNYTCDLGADLGAENVYE